MSNRKCQISVGILQRRESRHSSLTTRVTLMLPSSLSLSHAFKALSLVSSLLLGDCPHQHKQRTHRVQS